jgi:sister-chromatid-cohesion protein PDS5
MAMNVIFTKTTNFDMKEFPSETRIPTMYFKRADEIISNTKNYLPAELQINMNNPKGKGTSINSITNERPSRKTKAKQKETGIGPNETDARVRFNSIIFVLKFSEIVCIHQ